MDAFYASVEQRDQPSYRGKPIVVGGSPSQRGAVAAASYEARQFGIHSAMPSGTAYQKCPGLIFVQPRFEVYRAISEQIREIFYRNTDLVEPLALDEAYLDVTENKPSIPSATLIAQEIKQTIYDETQLTASADRPVQPNRVRKSIGAENSFEPDLTARTAMLGEIVEIAKVLKKRLDCKQTSGRTLTLKVKYVDYQQITCSKTLPYPIDDFDTIFNLAQELLALSEVNHKPVRLLGLTLSNLNNESQNEEYVQLCLWNDRASGLLEQLS